MNLWSVLSRELDMEVELFIGTDYTATVEAMRAGNLDVAMFGPFSYVLANDLPMLRPLP